MRQVHKYISKRVIRVHRHNQKRTFMHADVWGPQLLCREFYMHKVLQHSSNTHLPNLKHSSNTLHYSVLYQSINNHAHTPERAERAAPACAPRLPGSKVGHLVNTQTYTKAYVLVHIWTHTHTRLQVWFNNACVSIFLWSCSYACSLSVTLAGVALDIFSNRGRQSLRETHVEVGRTFPTMQRTSSLRDKQLFSSERWGFLLVSNQS